MGLDPNIYYGSSEEFLNEPEPTELMTWECPRCHSIHNELKVTCDCKGTVRMLNAVNIDDVMNLLDSLVGKLDPGNMDDIEKFFQDFFPEAISAWTVAQKKEFEEARVSVKIRTMPLHECLFCQ